MNYNPNCLKIGKIILILGCYFKIYNNHKL